jgi:hypothetical protein
MSTDYSKLSDAELSAAVAEKVARLKGVKVWNPNSFVKLTHKEGDIDHAVPDYSTSADAVLPLLEMWRRIAQARRPEGNFEWYGGHHKHSVEQYVELAGMIGGNIRYYAQTFARAACLALLAAQPTPPATRETQ